MIHKIYEGDVVAGESVAEPGVKPLQAARVKGTNGRYYHVLYGTQAELEAFVESVSPKEPA